MTSSQQARESLGNLTDLFTGMLGTDIATGGATPDTAPRVAPREVDSRAPARRRLSAVLADAGW